MDIKSFVGKLHNILIQFSVKYVHNYAENIECYVLMLYILNVSIEFIIPETMGFQAYSM